MSDLDAKAQSIADAMQTVGFKPVEAGPTPNGEKIAILFELMGNDTTPWHKAFECDAATASPEAFVLMWNQWTDHKRKEIAINLPSLTVGKAIRTYGLQAVMMALAPRKAPSWA